MNDLIAFLKARLDEDEEMARSAAECGAPTWDRSADVMLGLALANRRKLADAGVAGALDGAVRVHQCRHDPARVLREVEAMRVLLDDYERFVAERRRMMGGWDSYPEVSPVLAAFAAVYADHPDYRQEWSPQGSAK